MNHVPNPLSIAIIVTLALFAFGSTQPSQAASEQTEQFNCTGVTKIPQIECEALVTLYNETNGPGWKNNTDWLRTTEPCNWHGVTCDEGSITELRLWSESGRFGLQGDLPAEIGNFSNLVALYLGSNQFSSIPPEIGNLTNLTHLALWGSQLSSVPAEIWTLSNLIMLSLSDNDLQSIPADIENLQKLTKLHFHTNELSSLPPEIGTLTNLTTLSFENNNLSSLPSEIGNLTNLTNFWLIANNLSSLPTDFSNLNNLIELDLAYNRLVISDDELKAFVAANDSDWAMTQTIAPQNMEATVLGSDTIELSWAPITYQSGTGSYEISVAADDSFIVHGTASKSEASYMIDGLTGGRAYSIRIRTYTPAHNHGTYGQSHDLWSEYSPIVSATTPISANTPSSLEETEEPLLYNLFLPFIGNE